MSHANHVTIQEMNICALATNGWFRIIPACSEKHVIGKGQKY